jgi:hypothetical protein
MQWGGKRASLCALDAGPISRVARDTLSEQKFTLEGESRTLLSFVREKRAATRVSHAPSKNTKTAPGVNCMVKNRAISPLSVARVTKEKAVRNSLDLWLGPERDAAVRTPRSLGVKTLGVYCNLFSPLRCMLTNKQTCERERDKVVN